MPTVNVYDLEGQIVGELQLSDKVFGSPINHALLHQAIVTFEANQRAGTADTKTRSQVRGGGRKPWRQKGTGRARAGTIRAPHWRHGGVVFGPHPRDFSMKFPRKMRRAALRQALSAKLASDELRVVKELTIPEIKTKHVLKALDTLGVGRNVLFITSRPNENWKLAARNFGHVHTITTDNLNAYNLLRYHQIVLDTDAVARVEEVFGR